MHLDLFNLDTTPGTDHWAAPPAPVDDYTAWFRERFKTDSGIRQYCWVAARQVALYDQTLNIAGPHADDLRKAIMATHNPAKVAPQQQSLKRR